MIQHALRTVGDAIIDDEFDDKYERFYTASKIAGDKAPETAVIVTFRRKGDGVEYVDTRSVPIRDAFAGAVADFADEADDEEPVGPPPETVASRFGYCSKSNFSDNSVTKLASEKQPVSDKIDSLFDDWFDEDILGDLINDPLIRGINAVAGEHGDLRPKIEDDIRSAALGIEYRALLTISVIGGDGMERYPGQLDPFREGMRSHLNTDRYTKSSAQESRGFARCDVCDTETECYGLGAQMNNRMVFKQQWPFPNVNSSSLWRQRPLCADCIDSIEVATDRFISAQDYGSPGVRCRVIPYALPVEGGEERLRRFIKEARFHLAPAEGTPSDRPIADAWEAYRSAVESDDEWDASEDPLRLAFSHVVANKTDIRGVAWIDGVRLDQVARLASSAEEVLKNDPLFAEELLPMPDPPTERDIWTGRWVLRVLSGESGRNYQGDHVGDDVEWAHTTEQLMTRGTVNLASLIGPIVRDAHARYRDRLADQDYPYDGFHIAEAHLLVETLRRAGHLRDEHEETAAPRTWGDADRETRTTDDTHRTANHDRAASHPLQSEGETMIRGIDGEYTSFSDGIEEVINAYPSIASSPGRTAGFALGAVAAQLSNWQRRRNLSRTFIQNREVSALTFNTLPQWSVDIWEKAKTYNAQMGNYGVPWSGVRTLIDEAELEAENEPTGWNADVDEVRRYYVMGTQVGPRVSQQAKENYAEQEGVDEGEVQPEDVAVEDGDAEEASG